MSNSSTFYASYFVEELLNVGLRDVCVAPGSRHTPLILAFSQNKHRVRIHSHLDERSAAFFALGIALVTDRPVALVCTSGSAGANFFPAIIEAHQSRIPLIVLTADRPHELRQSGANQTIDQVKMFGDFVLWSYDTPIPESNPSGIAVRNMRTLASRAFAKADGLRKGVVHINVPFRKPLEPHYHRDDFDKDSSFKTPESGYGRAMTAPYTFVRKGYIKSHDADIEYLAEVIDRRDQGIIVCGPRSLHGIITLAKKLSDKINYPIFSDPLSNNRFYHKDKIEPYLMAGYETFLSQSHVDDPTLILHFGNVPTSKWLNEYLVPEYRLETRKHILINTHGDWTDDTHTVSDFLQLPEHDTLARLIGRVSSKNEEWFSRFKILEETTWQVIDHEIETGDYFDGAVVYDVVDLIPDGSTLFAGNSLPVRHLDQFGKPTNKRIFAYANRGASGIDGNISTALGTGAGRPDKPLVAILGDITFYHDMNGLLAVHRCGVPITIVLLNNDGGGIFHRLPIREHDPAFTDYFVTAHGLDYSHSAKLYGLDYVRADDRDAFRQAFTESVTNRKSTIIEVRTDAQADLKRRNEIVSTVHARLRELDL